MSQSEAKQLFNEFTVHLMPKIIRANDKLAEKCLAILREEGLGQLDKALKAARFATRITDPALKTELQTYIKKLQSYITSAGERVAQKMQSDEW